MNEPYRREVPSSRRLLERELALEVQPAPAIPVLQMPVAGPRRRVLEEVAAVARQGARQRRGVPGLDERRLRQPQLGFELASVEFHGEARVDPIARSEEHTSELQSHHDLVCRLLLEKNKHSRQTQDARTP